MFSLDPQFYSHLYILLVTVLSVFVFHRYCHYPQSRLNTDMPSFSFGTLFLTVLIILFIGFRPISGKYFVDMASYAAHFEQLRGDFFRFDWDTDNLLFDNLFYLLAAKNFSVELFFLLISTIYFGCIAFACSNLFPRDKLASILVYLGAFSTFTYGVNGIKAGAAASLFLIAISLHEKKKWLWMIVFLILSWGFHHSMLLPLAAFLVCLFIKNPRWFVFLWVLCFIIAALHITYFKELFASLIDEQGASYLLGDEEFIRHDILGGFRIDFILYSAVPIIVGWIAITKKHIRSKQYIFLLNLYILTNSVWLLCMYAEFTNRIAYLSWFMLPIVLIYPFLKEEWGNTQYQTFRWVAYGHLAFTLFMQYIYY